MSIGRDYLRYFDPPYREADLLRARATPFPRPGERILAAAKELVRLGILGVDDSEEPDVEAVGARVTVIGELPPS